MVQNSISSFQYVFFPTSPSNNFMLRLFTWIDHQCRRLRTQSYKTASPPPRMPGPCPGHRLVPLTHKVVNQRFPQQPPTWVQLICLKQLTTLRETFALLDHRFMRKDLTLEHMWRDICGKVWGKDGEGPGFPDGILSNSSRRSPTQKLLKTCCSKAFLKHLIRHSLC